WHDVRACRTMDTGGNHGAFKLVGVCGVFSEDCLSAASSAAAAKTNQLATGHRVHCPAGPER
ncbi:MAG: hypothetical protein V3T17_14075, partial [Pseudomonadales bacterium]